MEEILEIVEQINIVLIGFLLIALWRGYTGGKRGLVEETRRLVMLVATLFVLALGILLYTSMKAGNMKNIVLSVLILLVTGFVVKLVNFMMKSLAAIAHLPVISFLNGLLGGVIGIAEAVVILWILYIIVGNFDTGSFGVCVMEWTASSGWLQKLYEWNLIGEWITAGQ